MWDRAHIEDETLDSFTILTCPPKALMDEVHHRMPVILGQKAAREWMEGRGDPAELLRPCAMANLLGDIWDEAAAAGLPAPNWAAAAAFPDVKIHLYGKAKPRPGRKMGHMVAFGAGPGEAAERVLAARAALVAPSGDARTR